MLKHRQKEIYNAECFQFRILGLATHRLYPVYPNPEFICNAAHLLSLYPGYCGYSTNSFGNTTFFCDYKVFNVPSLSDVANPTSAADQY